MYKLFGKRIFDAAGASVGLLLVSPVLISVMVLLFIVNRGQVFFPQQRPGRHDSPFTIFKFKTMNDATDEHGVLLSDEERLTAVGRFVRKTSLDELLQLANVVKGDMSLIGPRPLLMRYLPRYTDYQRRRHEVRPGITGLAQVKGRNALEWKKRFRYDVFYIEHLSLLFDLKILFWTVQEVFLGRGVEFSGNIDWEFMGAEQSKANHGAEQSA